MNLEDFLIKQDKLTIVGGSPLFTDEIPEAISINGFHSECNIAAINTNKKDAKRCVGNFDHILAPYPVREVHESALTPTRKYELPTGFPDKQPTTYFMLLVIIDALQLPVSVYGICGWASKWHDGDWEMWYIKNHMKRTNLIDPRPRW